MSPEERQLITQVFERLRPVAGEQRDADAVELIGSAVREQPYAPYYLTQSVIIQEKAVETAAARIRELEEKLRQAEAALKAQNETHPAEPQRQGGFLGALFGSSQPPAQPRRPEPGPDSWGRVAQPLPAQPAYQQPSQQQVPPRAYADEPMPGPWSRAQASAAPAGGGFLRGALTTAAGVAGGVLVADALQSIFTPHMGGLAGAFGGMSNPLAGATPAVPAVEETIVNNYYGDDAIREAGAGAGDTAGNDDGRYQQVDDNSDDQQDYGDDGFDGGDDSMDV